MERIENRLEKTKENKHYSTSTYHSIDELKEIGYKLSQMHTEFALSVLSISHFRGFDMGSQSIRLTLQTEINCFYDRTFLINFVQTEPFEI